MQIVRRRARPGVSNELLAPPQQHIFDIFSNGQAVDEWSLNVLALSDEERRRVYGEREKAVLSVARALQPEEAQK